MVGSGVSRSLWPAASRRGNLPWGCDAENEDICRQASRQARRRAARSPASRTRAIEATLADIAHEIRTPLTGILALGELLATSELGERERGWAAAIKSTAEHLALLTSLIVDAARADAKGLVLRRELIRPRRFAEALAASLAARAEAKGIAAEVDLSSELPEAVIGDPLRLRAALENLIDNAVKFTERGSVRLAARSETAARGKVRLVFTVSDSGIGLSAAEIKRLFRPFAQANEAIARRYGGAGLGLAFVKRVAKAMGGDLTVTSTPGGGSRFRFSVTVDKVAEAPGAATPGRHRRRSARRCVRSRCCAPRTIPTAAYCSTPFSPSSAIARISSAPARAAVEAVAQGRYDVVLMDVTLPDIDGIEATRRIRALRGPAGRVPIVGVSGRGNAADEAAARAAGMDGYLAKPLSPSALTRVLGSVVPPEA